ncbi:MAG: hypothetical protein M3R70_05440 [Actinomycetota bacterium]|nr:hypothetical protein [Actinomycetota bacterium]
MSTQLIRELPRQRSRHAARALVVTGLGPLTVGAGVLWALLQPYRITLLHPFGQGFWWLVVEPPLLVMLVGVLFAALVAPGLLEDLEEEDEAGAASR